MSDAIGEMTTAFGQDRHTPVRLLWLFVRSFVVAGVFASATYAAFWVERDIRTTPRDAPTDAVSLPPGLELLTPLADAAEFERIVGVSPIIPAALPEGADATPRLHATQPDGDGRRVGELRFAAARGADGAGPGPSMLLRESKRRAEASAVRATAEGALTATLPCGAVAIDLYLYYPAARLDAEADAQAFVQALARQCGG